MGKKNEMRYLELNVPQDAIAEAAEIIEQNQIDATIIGRVEDEESITIGFDYAPEQRESIMEILELIEDHTNDDEDENDEVTEEDED